MKQICIIYTLIAMFIFSSCSQTPNIETTALVVNEKENKYFLHGKPITEEIADEYIEKNINSDKAIIFVEGNNIGVYTLKQADEFWEQLGKILFKNKEKTMLFGK